MNVTAAPRLVINGQTVSTDMRVFPDLNVSVAVLVGADPAFPRTYRKMVDFDPIGDRLCEGAELGDAIPTAPIEQRNGHVTGIRDDGGRQLDVCDCHRLVWPADMLTYCAGPDIFECALSLDINPLPASFQRQAMR